MNNVTQDACIRHDRPAGEDWLRALPLGNGHMGAMVFGNPGLEKIQLNEDTFYTLEPEECHEPFLRMVRETAHNGRRVAKGFLFNDASGVQREATVCMGTTMDQAIVRETLTNTLTAAKHLGLDEPVLAEIRDKCARLLDYQIAPNGTLMEWSEDFAETEPEHRHISHLYGFFPGDEITTEKRPDLIEAVRATLDRRGDGASGWSMGWKLNCWACLGDGAHFQNLLNNLLTPERTAPNLFDLHPPFQIDGNFGAARAITETRVQDHRGFIDLLPALPPAWPDGSIRGLRCRGGLELDLDWHNHVVTKAVITSSKGGPVLVRINGRIRERILQAGVPAEWRNE